MGDYVCVISQKKFNETIKHVVNFTVKLKIGNLILNICVLIILHHIWIKPDEPLEGLKVIQSPTKLEVNLGDQFTLSAKVNTKSLHDIKFEWYKLNVHTNQEEVLSCESFMVVRRINFK